MEEKFLATKDSYMLTGLLSVIVSAGIYGIASLSGLDEDQFFGIFVVNYLISATYFCALWFSGRFRRNRNGLNYFFLSLVLFLISAYSLNHMIPIFEHSVPWLTILLVIVGAAYCSIGFFDSIHPFLRNIIASVIGVGYVLFIYLAIYLLPLFPVGVIGSIALGISLHSFAPLLFVIFTTIWLIEKALQYRNVLRSFLCGTLFSVIAVIIFFLQWNSIDELVSSRYQHSLVDKDTDLPSWIKVAQVIPENYIAEAYLKSSLVYSTYNGSIGDFEFGMPRRRSFDEVRKHDPFIMISSVFNRSNQINEEERIRILRAVFDARHKTEERLWSGSDLETSNVISDVRIWPQFRIAYTEKTITVANKDKTAWGRNQEAIYTFHLPEGGVVTSLSLWINGIESKGILTTKGKADNAYKQIVGVENRDPSVVHWQEGNRVTVRVFPVPEDGNRIFRIGITAPLAFNNNELQYRNISFEGPWANDAGEIVRVKWEQAPGNGIMDGYDEKGDFLFEKERKYVKDWSIKCKAPPLKENAFLFNGTSYQIRSYVAFKKTVMFDKVYLDLNSSWTETEYETVLAALAQKAVYIYDDGLIQVRADNKGKLFDRFCNRQFSMFPLQAIHHPETSLLITKSGNKSSDISDIKETAFAARLDEWLNRNEKLCVFNLGEELNPYLKTLKEHRAFLYEHGGTKELEQDIKQGVFAGNQEDENHVVIDHASIVITRSGDSLKNNAPDHLMRLFAYNHLMQQLKAGIFHNLEADTALVNEAQQAYVVTPLSSLVVLETAADYERFDIKDTNNSLQNASMKSTGAVPEPHEWALIIIAAVILVWMTYKNKIRSLWLRS